MQKATMVLEGGATRGVFSSGALDYLMEQDFYTSHVVGVSAGSCNGVDYVSKQIGRTRDCMIHKEKEYDYHVGFRKFVKEKSILDMDMVFDKYPKEIFPFDFDTYFASEMECEIVTTNCVTGKAEYMTERSDRDRLMKWICFQPYLRRLFGCSFLPHHDYGRGGRGWRDLWQDCLSLLLMEPGQVGQMIEANYGGVRVDGTNATIIGAGDGNFIADRNGIARVWMDHALWPQMTTKLYIDQTGDSGILERVAPYFKDPQAMRGNGIDDTWTPDEGNWQRTAAGEIYQGTILEHLLVEQLTAFYDVGEHNLYRLRGADWNDALDMAAERGESVAFTCAYAGNLRELAEMIQTMDKACPGREIELLEELAILLGGEKQDYDDIQSKQERLKDYLDRCRFTVSGQRMRVKLSDLAEDLQQRADWLTEHLRRQEWIDHGEEGWFNSYYDNDGQAVEGIFPSGVRMMLTGQVFAIMGKVADDEQIKQITRSADHYLYRPEIGGYRLNTDFNELKFNLGRMFGFAYGEKENGAVFSHMTVMYANALYRRGFAREGWKALKTLADAALHFETSRIYPGIPEYFSTDGRGVYHYLTGAGAWTLRTVVGQMYGIRGRLGAMFIEPKLLARQFDRNGTASVKLRFGGLSWTVTYFDPLGLDYGQYRPELRLDGMPLPGNTVPRRFTEEAEPGSEHRLEVFLKEK